MNYACLKAKKKRDKKYKSSLMTLAPCCKGPKQMKRTDLHGCPGQKIMKELYSESFKTYTLVRVEKLLSAFICLNIKTIAEFN